MPKIYYVDPFKPKFSTMKKKICVSKDPNKDDKMQQRDKRQHSKSGNQTALSIGSVA